MPFDGVFSPLHWLIVGIVAAVVLKPDQLPRAAREAGRAFRLIRDARWRIGDHLSALFDTEDEPAVSEARDELNAPLGWTDHPAVRDQA